MAMSARMFCRATKRSVFFLVTKILESHGVLTPRFYSHSMKTTKLSVPHNKNGGSSSIPIVIDYPDGDKKVDTAIVLTHGASGDYSSGNLPLLGEF